MNSLKPPNLVIFADPEKRNVNEAVGRLVKFAESKANILSTGCIKDCDTQTAEAADYAVIFGGDGSIITAARKLASSRLPLIGVNLGKLGFLAEFSVEELEKFFDHIITGRTPIEKRTILACSVSADGSEIFTSTAVNDLFITAGNPFRVIELKIFVDDEPLAGCVSDGLIIATPTGSTAYNLSAGGPILSADIPAMVVTPICPHSLSFRPIVISENSKVRIIPLKLNEGTTLSVDGQLSCKLSAEEQITITKSPHQLIIVNNPSRTKWDTLATKLNWAEKPKYLLD